MLPGARQLFSAEGGLPSGLVPVEWLQGTGTQWIDTGVALENGVAPQVEVDFQFTSYPTGVYKESWVYGYWNTVPSARLYLVGMFKGYIRAGAGPDASTYYAQITADLERHVAGLFVDGAYVDGVRKTSTALDTVAEVPGTTIRVFRSPHVDSGGGRRVFRCRMWDLAGTPLRDFIPVRDGSAGGMYDLVTGRAVFNGGSGLFTVGPDREVL